jgi:hypothetical protein
MANNAVAGLFVNVRVEGATDEDVFKAADLMGLWTPPGKDVPVYDKRDNTGVFIYARKYLNPKPTTVSVAGPGTGPKPQPPRVQPRTVRRAVTPAPTSTDGGPF